MQSVSSRIWTRVAVSIFYDDNHYTTGSNLNNKVWYLDESMQLSNLISNFDYFLLAVLGETRESTRAAFSILSRPSFVRPFLVPLAWNLSQDIWGCSGNLIDKRWVRLTADRKKSFKHAVINMLNAKATIWKKINVSFIVHFFSLGKYNFSLDTFSTQLVFWGKLTFLSLFISLLVNTASVSILFQHSSYFEEN